MSNKIAVGSIGSAGEPFFDAHNKRVKGFCTSARYNGTEEHEKYTQKALDLMRATGAERASVRLVVRDSSSQPFDPLAFNMEYQGPSGHAYGREAVVPLSGSWNGFNIEYHAFNSPGRIEPEEKRGEEDELLRSVMADPRSPKSRNGYEIFTGINPGSDIEQLFELYTAVYDDYTFPITYGNISELALNPKSIIATGRAGGRIVSAAVAEVIEIEMDGGMLRISEISDEATHPDHRRNGLNQSCVSRLTEELLSTYGHDLHLAYSEDRAVSYGVNRQSANLGWKYAGRLNRHCIISGEGIIDVDGPFEDLNVWHYPLEGRK